MSARKTTMYRFVLIGVLSSLAIAFGASRPASEMQEQEFRQEWDRIESVRRSFRPGPVNDLKEYERYAEKIQAKWRHRDSEHYARLMLELCHPVTSGNFKEERRYELARQYALSALEVRDDLPLRLELELALRVFTDMYSRHHAPRGDDLAQRRSKDVEVRLHAWQRLLDAIDPEWDPDEELMFDSGVMPPPGVTSFDSGMDPARIKDPALRAQYEQALKANREKNAKWGEQYRLRGWLKRFPKDAERYIIDAYSRPPFNLKELEQYLAKYIADEKTRARIIDTVKRNMEKQGG